MTTRRHIAVALALAAAAAWLASRFIAVDPLRDWVLPRLLASGACALALGGGCVLAGRRVLHWLLPDEVVDGELTISFALGLLVFFLIVFAGGVLHVFGAPFFVAAVAALFVVGLWNRPLPPVPTFVLSATGLELLLFVAGVLACVVAALPVLALDNLSYDARWYHLGLAEQYAVAGGLVDFKEGLAQASVSHLTSWLDAWAFQLPGGLFDRLMLTRWLEVLVFVATLTGLPALARTLSPEQGPHRLAWVAFFLFPSIYLYDTGLLGGADHVCAAFAIPAWLALVRFWKQPDVKRGLLVAAPVAGLALTKYTAVILVVPIALGVVVAAARSRERRAAWLGVGSWVGAGLVLTAPHWLTNFVLRGSPVYPALCGQLACTPWTPNSAAWVVRYVSEAVDLDAQPQSVGGAMTALVDYSWARYTFLDFHGLRPVFGSLFTLGLPALLFLRGSRKVWALVLALHASLLLWYLLAHQERYLVPLVPLMAGVVAVTLSLAWAQGTPLVRGLVLMLIGVQLVGTADVPFLPTHRAHGESPLARAAYGLGAGFTHTREEQLRDFRAFESVGAALPADAVVLLHRNFLHLGIGRRVMTDTVPHTLGLDYATLGSPRAVRDRLASLGVTHVGTSEVTDQDSLGAELLFRAFVVLGTRPLQAVSGWRLSTLEATVSETPAPFVLVAGCGTPLSDGLYTLEQLGAPWPAAGLAIEWPSRSSSSAPATWWWTRAARRRLIRRPSRRSALATACHSSCVEPPRGEASEALVREVKEHPGRRGRGRVQHQRAIGVRAVAVNLVGAGREAAAGAGRVHRDGRADLDELVHALGGLLQRERLPASIGVHAELRRVVERKAGVPAQRERR